MGLASHPPAGWRIEKNKSHVCAGASGVCPPEHPRATRWQTRLPWVMYARAQCGGGSTLRSAPEQALGWRCSCWTRAAGSSRVGRARGNSWRSALGNAGGWQLRQSRAARRCASAVPTPPCLSGRVAGGSAADGSVARGEESVEDSRFLTPFLGGYRERHLLAGKGYSSTKPW